MTGFYSVLAIVVLLAGGGIWLYNRLVSQRQMVANGWSDIDVQLKRRTDLIPQLVTTVKAYAAHEKSLFEEVTEKRAAALAQGDNREGRARAESALTRPVGRLIALAENYPDLKANEQFLALQRGLTDTEDKIEMARRFFNGAVREFNITVESFPANLLAGMMGFEKADFFDIERADRAVPSLTDV